MNEFAIDLARKLTSHMPNPAPKTVTAEDDVITESNSVRVLIPYCAGDTVYEALILAIALL
jgi:hypothetical protein